MKCTNCGSNVPQWANKCPDCGTVRLVGGAVQPDLPLRSHLGIAILVSCCCPPIGTPAIVYAVLAEVRMRAGQRDEAFAMADQAWYWIRLALTVSLAIAMLVVSLYLWLGQ